MTRTDLRITPPYLIGNVLLADGETSLIKGEPCSIAFESSTASVVASLNNLVTVPNLLTTPLLTIRRFLPRFSASFSVFFDNESERLDTMTREKVPRNTPSIAKALLSLKIRSDRIAILRFKYSLFIPV